MTAWWLDLLARGWELIVVGFILIVGAAIWVGPGDDYSCAPSEDDEEFPEDPDRDRDWQIADEMGAM